MELTLYRKNKCWVFDDAEKGLKAEAFVMGASEALTIAMLESGIERPYQKKVRMKFTRVPKPGYPFSVTWKAPGVAYDNECGNWYTFNGWDMDLWLCPNLLQYFDKPPMNIYFKFEEVK